MKNIFFSFFTLIVISVSAQSWFQITSNTDIKLNAIDFPSERVGYIVGNDSLFLKTINGGKSWQRRPLLNVDFASKQKAIRHVEFITEWMGYMIVESDSSVGLLYKTIDGGNSWKKDTNSTICFPKATHIFDEDNAIVIGGGCSYGETVERFEKGVWQGQNPIHSFLPFSQLLTVDFLNNNFGLVAGTSDVIFRTNDGGKSWLTAKSTIDTSISDITIINDSLAYATYPKMGSVGAIVTKDGGATWTTDFSMFSFFSPAFNAIEKTNSDIVYIGGKPGNGRGIMQYQQGEFWRFELVDQEIYDIATIGDSIVFAVGDSGYIITNRDPLFLSIQENEFKIDAKIYPIPAKDVLHIEFKEKKDYPFSLINLQGQTIIESNSKGQTEIDLDISHLIPGIYVVQLKSSSAIQTKKIIITH